MCCDVSFVLVKSVMNREFWSLSLAAMLPLLAIGPARAQEGPARSPTRDVIVVYKVARADGESRAGKIVITYDVVTPRTRIDSYILPDSRSPYQGLIFNGRSKTVTSLVYANQVAIEAPSSGVSAPGLAGGAEQRFEGGNNTTVAGTACKEWRSAGPPNPDWALCVTADGVVLRSHSNLGAMEAVQVSYGALAATAFDWPPNTRRMNAPPKAAQPTPPPAAKP